MVNRALLIGFNDYRYLTPLKYAEADAEATAASLKKNYDFRDEQVVLMTSRTQFQPTVENILAQLRKLLKESLTTRIDLLTIGFFGHGFGTEETRYLCGPDTLNTGDDLDRTALPLEIVMNYVRRIRAKTTALFLDCCRNDPKRGNGSNVFSTSEGGAFFPRAVKEQEFINALDKKTRDAVMEREKLPETTAVAVLNACSDRQFAHEWDSKKHGVFTSFLLDGFDQKLETVEDCFKYVTQKMQAYPNREWGLQQPYYHCFGSGVASLFPDRAPAWKGVGGNAAPNASAVTAFPDPFDPNDWTLSQERDDGGVQSFTIAGVEYPFCWIPKGSFAFGGEEEGVDVEFEQGFWMLKTPVTQKMWTSLCGEDPAWFAKDGQGADAIKDDSGKLLNTENFPVENVDWDSIKLFLRLLQSHIGYARLPKDMELRLPTEQEWEYCARAGQYRRYAGTRTIDEVAWFKDNSDDRTHDVDDNEKKSNDWNLRGMTGNVREICVDLEANAPACTRGGAWNDDETACPTVKRAELPEDGYANNVGFRLVFAKKAVKPVVKEPPKPKNPWAEDAKRKAGSVETLTLGGINYPFHWCPAGTFRMGDHHDVKLTRGFWLLETPVTQRMWKSIKGNNPSNFKGDERPVECVSWNVCKEFFETFAEKYRKENPSGPKLKFWFPTEAQWEYACRAGQNYEYSGSNNLDSVAWYGGNSGKKTHDVRRKDPNAWGLFDMSGNVWEWCSDWYDSNYPNGTATDPQGPSSGSNRVGRGGSWLRDASYCRCAYRCYDVPENSWSNVGFRLLLESVQ